MAFIVLLSILWLASNAVSTNILKTDNTLQKNHKEFLYELQKWISDVIEKPFPPNCQKPCMKNEGSTEYLLQKVSCKQGGAKNK